MNFVSLSAMNAGGRSYLLDDQGIRIFGKTRISRQTGQARFSFSTVFAEEVGAYVLKVCGIYSDLFCT